MCTAPDQNRRGERGGAVVELAIATVVLVPLVLYSTWFADVAHWKLKLEEASIAATMDLTAWRVNNLGDTSPAYATFYRNAIEGVTHSPESIQARMAYSFDSGKPGAFPYQQAVFVVPKQLSVTCNDFQNGKPAAATLSYTMNESRKNEHVPELNIHTWVTCSASAKLRTAGMPHRYEVLGSKSTLFASTSALLPLCGVGPGVQGCGHGRSAGLSIMLDDWGLWDLSKHEDLDVPMSLADWRVDSPTATGSENEPSHHNDDYLKMAKRFWRSPQQWSTVAVMEDAMGVANAQEMGKTDAFHMSYRFGAEHNYQTSEIRNGQRGAYGGPDGVQRPNPHTGGPWHEHLPYPGGTGISEQVWNRRAEAHYLGVPAWPVDKR